ncbi:transcriptional regulator NrdR [Rickettsiales endosymbiont of Stachyamoeba lipophora]|uniref:transcriptional regulator NrdR n=1 Tax=Rickettsiales endosymbiont of Stachyamoeba lipophora TaxID=2486578 RepID=UPI000F64CBE2|nr:transcriptional regulator NrdR [Rickettsiales endosymbiont of Stachyamoeba lipophora]AZL16167.1 transcriptional repressor NrdR [Rickettsiales endosymbiont of Stachyamoeba lipophora]
MKCPFCGYEDTQVKDSRSSEDGMTIRRRRVCSNCNGRFTTFERIQLRDITVVKKSGEKKVFDRDKVYKSLQTALRKRNVSGEKIEQKVNQIIMKLDALGESEVTTTTIGEMVMEALKELDQIAYIRYASVYRDFCEVDDFEQFLKSIKKKKTPKKSN